MRRFNTVFNTARISAVIAVLFLVMSVTAQAGDFNTSTSIENFGQINPEYYRGGQPEGRDYADLAAIGIRTVINLTSDDAEPNEKSMVEKAGMTYIQIPMTTHENPTAEKLEAFLRIVNDPANQPVYVHCVGGKHRTGVMTAVYRMTKEGWTADQAYKEMKDYKFGSAFLHPQFKNFVFDYYHQLGVTGSKPLKTAAASAGQ